MLTFPFFLLCITFTFCHPFSIYFSVALSPPVTLSQTLCLNLLILVHQTRVWQRINCATLCLIHTNCCNSQLDWLDSIKLTLFVTWLREIDLNIGRFKDWSFFITWVYIIVRGLMVILSFFFVSYLLPQTLLSKFHISSLYLHFSFCLPLIYADFFPSFSSYSFPLFFILSTYLPSPLLIVLSLSSFPFSFLSHFCLHPVISPLPHPLFVFFLSYHLSWLVFICQLFLSFTFFSPALLVTLFILSPLLHSLEACVLICC